MSTPFELFTPAKTALLVIDKQRAYADAELLEVRDRHLPDNFNEVLAKMDQFIAAARELGVEIIWTQMTEDQTVSPAPISLKMQRDYTDYGLVPVAAKPGAPDYDFAGSVLPESGEYVIHKSRYDAFSEPELTARLQAKSIESVVLIGGFTPRCVLATAYGANANDFHVLLLSDLCFEPVEFAEDTPAAHRIISAILGYVETSENLERAWRA